MIVFLVQPIARITEISLHCSYRLPVILLDKEKKQMNIVIAITTLKMISRVFSACINHQLERVWRVAYLLGVVKKVLV